MDHNAKLDVITDKNVQDIIDTAAYGGITYWAVEPDWEAIGVIPNHIVMTVQEGDDEGDGKLFHLTASDVREAYLRLLDLDQTFVNREIHGYVIDSWRNRDADGIDCGEIDAGAADCIIQIACFGEVVYG